MSKITDIKVIGTRVYFISVKTRVPLKFGTETLTSVTCARVALRVQDPQGRTAEGWGETPLSVQWVWPSPLPYEQRHTRLKTFVIDLGKHWACYGSAGHALEVGHGFQQSVLPQALAASNGKAGGEVMPWLAALVCCSAFDLALHDAYGQLHRQPVYQTYGPDWLNHDLAHYLEPAARQIDFRGRFPRDFLAASPPTRLRAWHLVGGMDAICASDLTGHEPSDGYPVLLEDWIARDGLKCLKIKLRGSDGAWDWQRMLHVGEIARRCGVEWLSADFNCTVQEPSYVNDLLDRLRDEHPSLYGMLLYVEQPFPYELEQHQIDVHSVSSRKPLFLDESAHDWKLVRLGRELGWSGVALKTCKTQTGALLSACWARAHSMTLMVQDLTNPMLAQIPHCLLAAHAGTIMGVETNAMQFYPEASAPEATVHPGLYRRREGIVDLGTIAGPGFGYRLDEIKRVLPEPAAAFGS
jgi:L-alanine-DL-glutamate epimerase-like enolase superfamily enzyme